MTTALGRHARRSIPIGIACVLGVCVYLLYLYHWASLDHARTGLRNAWESVVTPFRANATVSSSGRELFLCTAEEYATGQWVRRVDLPRNMYDIRHLYSVTDKGRLECDPPGWPVTAKGQVTLDNPEHIARMLNNTRWRWQPESDCRRYELSEEAFVVRMLRSRAGMVMVGDSLVEQHHQIIRNMLHSSTGPFELRSHGNRPRIDSIFLNPTHNLTTHYLKLAGVTEERLRNPITTFILERHLLLLAEFDQAFAHPDGYVPLSSEGGLHQWVSESIWSEKYRKLLEKPVVFREGDTVGIVEEPTILLLNTGPHWIAREVAETGVSDQDLLQGYENMIDIVMRNLTEPSTSMVKIWYRASMPGHMDCKDILEPAVENASWRTSPDVTAYNWHLMQPFNDAWKTRIDKAVKENALGMSYLDVWPLSLQRGDSHLLPPTDCLHFCTQGVVEEWQQFLWQEIVRESLNEDYDTGRPVYL